MSANLFDLIVAHTPEPERLFLRTPDGRRLTYGEMIAAAGRYANVLTGLGVKVGDRVAVQVEKSVDAILLYLGCVRAGAVYLPLNTGYTLAELEYFIGDAEPALVVCSPEKREGVLA